MNSKVLLFPTALVAMGCAQQKKEVKSKPNIIIVMADDLGFGDVSAYGSKTINTPNMDKLANEGIKFTNAYATSATSTPSRYAMFTGMYPWKNKNAHILAGDAPLIISTQQPTLPKMMQEIGYKTGAVGKWHLGIGKGKMNWNTEMHPNANDIGFDYSCLIAATNDRVPTVYVENGSVENLDPNDPIEVDYHQNFPGEPDAISNPEMLKMDWTHGHNYAIVNGIPRIGYMKGGKSALWVDENMADHFSGKVKNFLCQNQDKPFFLYYGLHEPHVPRDPNPRFVGKTTMGPRGDAIMEADWCVGRLMNILDSLKLTDNTLIVFTSDNGPVLDDGYMDYAVRKIGNHKQAGGLRGGKYSLYDGGTHVPFFVYWKGKIQPSTSNELFTQLDLFGSIGKLVGGNVPEGLDTQEHLNVMLGKKDAEARKNLVLEASGALAFREGDYVMIPAYQGVEKAKTTGIELGNLPKFTLFNLKKDPTQHTISENTEVLNKMKSQFLDITKGFYPKPKYPKPKFVKEPKRKGVKKVVRPYINAKYEKEIEDYSK